jgi:predicted methyltransferase
MKRSTLLVAAALALLAGSAAAQHQHHPGAPTHATPSPDVVAALADPKRPAEDRARDAARKPAELLALADIEVGDKVGDWVMGGGYVTRILAAAVGPNGRVYAYQPTEFVAYMAKYGTDQDAIAAAYPNVTPIRAPLNAYRFPEPLDAIITVQNYHDLYLKNFPADTAPKARAELFRALKPGGVLVVVDHSAADGSGTRDADSLHRIDKAAVIKELTDAGFRLEGEHQLYANPADPRTGLVFDPAIRGKSDQFTLVFRKPA